MNYTVYNPVETHEFNNFVSNNTKYITKVIVIGVAVSIAIFCFIQYRENVQAEKLNEKALIEQREREVKEKEAMKKWLKKHTVKQSEPAI